MDNFIIRAYSEKDSIEELLAAFYIKMGFLKMYEEPGPALDAQITSDIGNMNYEEQASCFVAEYEEKLVGFLMYHFHFSDCDELRRKGSAESFSYVAEDYQNQGIATRLREYSIEHLQPFKEKGIDRLVSCVDNRNLPAIRVLEKTGFNRVALRSSQKRAYAKPL
jgi:RimJ/RimL family protein N-acetyltransferase